MKQLKIALTVLLSTCLSLSSLASLSALAAQGPNKNSGIDTYIKIGHLSAEEEDNSEDYEYEEEDDKKGRIYDNGTIDNTVEPGMSYDSKTNTLTLKNVNSDDCMIYAQAMGDDFKISVIGDNNLTGIFVFTDSYGGSLELIGNGSLTLNKKFYLHTIGSPISIYSDAKSSVLKISPDINLSVHTEGSYALRVEGTSVADNAISIIQSKDKAPNIQKIKNISNVPDEDTDLVYTNAHDVNYASNVYLCMPKRTVGSTEMLVAYPFDYYEDEEEYYEDDPEYEPEAVTRYRVYSITENTKLNCYLATPSKTLSGVYAEEDLEMQFALVKFTKNVVIPEDYDNIIYGLENYKKDGKTYGVIGLIDDTEKKAKYKIYEYTNNSNYEYPLAKLVATTNNLDDSFTPVAGEIFYDYYCVLSGQVVFPAHKHAPKAYAEIPATKATDGVKAHYYCQDCGRYYLDADCKTEVTYDSLRIAKSSANALKDQVITTAKIKSYKAKQLKKKKISFNLNAKTSGDGKLTYKVTKYPKKMKKFISVSKAGKVTLKKKAKKGSYKITITATATNTFKKAEKTITIKVK